MELRRRKRKRLPAPRGSRAQDGRRAVGAAGLEVGGSRGAGAGGRRARPCAAAEALTAPRPQLRREARLRREYLYRKAREEAQRAAREKKDKVRRALEGTPSPPAAALDASL